MPNNKVMLIVLDGWGLNQDYPGNAISQAKTPFFDQLWSGPATAKLQASGEAVGLPAGQMGTSEVNHFTIGAGKIVPQDLVRVNQAIETGSFYQNNALFDTFSRVKRFGSVLHVWGLASNGGVHSKIKHILATVEAAKQAGVNQVAVHAVTDGRDTAPESGLADIMELETGLAEIGVGRIVSLVGRYYAMDRDKNWDRTDQAFNLYTKSIGSKFDTAQKALQASYQAGVTNEFVKPAVIGQGIQVQNNDAIIMVNFRSDRPRQIVERFLSHGPNNLFITTMTQYNSQYPVGVIFPPVAVKTTLGQAISQAGLKQLRITETEKFAHMTFFLNCKKEEAYPGEERFMLDSYSDIATHDQRPEMRAPDIANKIVKEIEADKYSVIFTNICNADMVGHTGNILAAITACEAVDQALAKIIPVAQAHGFEIIITADHGNAEEMLGENGEIITSHSTNLVPMILLSPRFQELTHTDGTVADLAPTILKLLGLQVPAEMTGQSFV